MLHLVYGGSGSGKSAYAESLVEKYASGPRYYLATMQVFGKEDEERIARHRRMREKKQFTTIEKQTDVGDVILDGNATVLLECMSNLVANEMFRKEAPRGDEAAGLIADKILADICRLQEQVANLVIVTANVFDDGVEYSKETEAYQQALAICNERLGGMADSVTEVVVGIPLTIRNPKGRCRHEENFKSM